MAIHIKESHKGLLHKDLGVPKGKPIPAGKLAKAKKSENPAVRKRAVFAENAKHFKHAAQPHPKTNPGFYDTEPHVPAGKVAGNTLAGSPSVGAGTPKMVPHSPGRFDGVGGPAHNFPKTTGTSHGYGHAANQRVGHERLSGHSGGHRIGKK